MASAPSLGNNLWSFSQYLMDQLSILLSKMNKKRQQLNTRVRCQLAITEFGGSKCWSL